VGDFTFKGAAKQFYQTPEGQYFTLRGGTKRIQAVNYKTFQQSVEFKGKKSIVRRNKGRICEISKRLL
jgi:hypothetical protein